MAAIAQTVDGKETFETKKELFDYALSQLFGWEIYSIDGQYYLQAGTTKLSVTHAQIQIKGRPNMHNLPIPIGLIKLDGIYIPDWELVTGVDRLRDAPQIFVFSPNGTIFKFFDNTISELKTISKINGKMWIDMTIKANTIEFVGIAR